MDRGGILKYPPPWWCDWQNVWKQVFSAFGVVAIVAAFIIVLIELIGGPGASFRALTAFAKLMSGK
jgi:hypothetical protein